MTMAEGHRPPAPLRMPASVGPRGEGRRWWLAAPHRAGAQLGVAHHAAPRPHNREVTDRRVTVLQAALPWLCSRPPVLLFSRRPWKGSPHRAAEAAAQNARRLFRGKDGAVHIAAADGHAVALAHHAAHQAAGGGGPAQDQVLDDGIVGAAEQTYAAARPADGEELVRGTGGR